MAGLATDVRVKILIAEDDAIVALDLQGMVMRLGYDVVAIVDNGQAAVAAVKRFRPDIILMDIVLSGPLDGIEVARAIQSESDVPIIFCISSPDLAVLVRAKKISYAGYLLKPINPDSLSTTLDTTLYKYKLEKRVQKAEEKYQQLVGKCEIVQMFMENNIAFEWSWSGEKGPHISGDISSLFPGCQEMENRLDRIIRHAIESGSLEQTNRIAFCLPVDDNSDSSLALLGIRKDASNIFSGLIIPLNSGKL